VHVHSIDGLCYTATAPPLPSPPTALAFMPNTAVLTIACANKQVSQFDVDRLMPTPWGLQHARPIGAVSGSSNSASTGQVAANGGMTDQVLNSQQSNSGVLTSSISSSSACAGTLP
jgi:hypothetical protein